MYVSGIGKTKFGILNASLPELAYGAMAKAVEDSGIDAEKIEAIYIGNFLGGSFQNQLHLNSIVASLLPKNKIPIVRMESACASGGAALHYALEGMHKFENVLVLGIEKMSDASTSNAAKYIGAAGDRILDQAEGLIFPANYALIAGQHMLKYGTTSNDLALVALKNHENANFNENAHFYGKKVNLEMIENSPMVCSPLRLYDCSPISDGAAALVISRERKSARDVEIIASAFATDTISLAQRNDATTFDAAKRAAESAYKEAGISAKDVDFAEVHDCFTIAEMVAMEDLGFCKKGESKGLIRSGATKLNAELPINASGGLKASGHPIGATGVSQICEIAIQLRGEAQKRQIKGANIGLAHNVGGIGGSCAVHILRGK